MQGVLDEACAPRSCSPLWLAAFNDTFEDFEEIEAGRPSMSGIPGLAFGALVCVCVCVWGFMVAWGCDVCVLP